MDIVTTSLDALLQRATNPQNQNVDTAAVEAFCVLINKERDGSHIGVKLLSSRLHSAHEKEVLQTLNIIDTCMQKCGNSFQSEVGKFRFLNEMIKLVSPKYLGSHTPLSVRQKVLQLMYLWTLDYPKESKIREAYDMLKKQGVIKELPLSVNSENCVLPTRRSNSIFQDEEKSKLLQKLLQSKNPADLQAANRLIKCMVKEEDKREEMKSRRVIELESVHNNVRLLSEMLDSYRKGSSSNDELDLINELYQSCERLRPNVLKLAAETQQNEELLNEILRASDELAQIFDKYKDVMVIRGTNETKSGKSSSSDTGPSLLDFGPSDNDTSDLMDDVKLVTAQCEMKSADYDILCDLFMANIPNSMVLPQKEILKPVHLSNEVEALGKCNDDKSVNKTRALEDLDELSENLLKQNLQSNSRQGAQFKLPDKIPMNMLTKQQDEKVFAENTRAISASNVLDLDLNFLLDKPIKEEGSVAKIIDTTVSNVLINLVDVNKGSDEQRKPVEDVDEKDAAKSEESTVTSHSIKCENKLSDLYVELKSIKPSNIPPIAVISDDNGINITLQFAKDKPKEDVTVIVVTISNKSETALKNILFRGIVPKMCKIKLQPASATDLPPHNPFLPPSVITQILLLLNPNGIDVSLKLIVTYSIDEEIFTEIGEVDHLPVIR